VSETYGPLGLARHLHHEGYTPESLQGNVFSRPTDGFTLTATVEGANSGYWASTVAEWMKATFAQ
jgi:hypothetical protein